MQPQLSRGQPPPTRTNATVIALGAVLVLSLVAKEALWRVDHPLTSEIFFASPSGVKIAEVRFMPEGSSVPYVNGVFVHAQWMPLLSIQSELAFAGNCRTITPKWSGEDKLTVECESLEGNPVVKSTLDGGVAVHVMFIYKQPSNPSIQRKSAGPFRYPAASNNLERYMACLNCSYSR